MKSLKLILTLSFLILLSSLSFAAGGIKGKVLDKNTHEPLAYVTIRVEGQNGGTISHADGSFELKGLDEGNYDLQVEMNGYEDVEICNVTVCNDEFYNASVEIAEDAWEMEKYSINIAEVDQDLISLEPVTIYAQATERVSSWNAQRIALSQWVSGFMTWARGVASLD
ncbi:MAG: carboxypeptidase-like regulatory domain-containing protein [Bacteroidia bacterium]|nr:carboxypeptidase-like regulatory domain-containing protein [Bacteroidia bacterium]